MKLSKCSIEHSEFISRISRKSKSKKDDIELYDLTNILVTVDKGILYTIGLNTGNSTTKFLKMNLIGRLLELLFGTNFLVNLKKKSLRKYYSSINKMRIKYFISLSGIESAKRYLVDNRYLSYSDKSDLLAKYY